MLTGDYAPGTILYGKFSAWRPSTGGTYGVTSAVIRVYKDNSTTESSAGVTTTTNFDGLAGLHHFAIDTSADGTFYSAGSNFDVILFSGTVDGVDVSGTVVGSFSLNKEAALKPSTAGNTLAVDGSGYVTIGTIASAALTAIAGAVWNALLATYNTASTFGAWVQSITGGDSAATIWSYGTRILTAGTNIALAKGTGLTGLNDISTTDVQSAMTSQGYTTTRAGYLDTLNGLVTAIWSAGTRTLTSFGTLVSDIWAAVVDSSGVTTLLARLTSTRAGYLDNLTNLDATVSSRSTYAGTDTSGTTTLLSRLTGTRATNLDNLDAAVSSRSTLAAADVWDRLNSAITTSGSIGKFIIDSLNSLLTAVAGGDMATKTADSSTLTTGVNVSNSYTDTATDDNTNWVTRPTTPAVGGFGLRQQMVFNLPLGRIPIGIFIRGWFASGSTRVVDVYALDSRTGTYRKLTNTGTNLANRTTELAYSIPLARDFGDSSGGAYNIVTLEFRSASVTTGDRLNLDEVVVVHLAEDAPVTLIAPTAADIWSFPSRTLTDYGVEPEVPTVAAIADGVWDEARSGHATQGTYGESFSLMQSVTVTATVSTTAFIDTGLSGYANADQLVGRQFVWRTGNNVGQAQFITAFDETTQTITVADAWGTTIVVGDTGLVI